MIQTINPYATARTAEIMSRYRPIAPKPDSPASSAIPTGIRKSPYLRNVWAHLQARPTRTRKRGRTAAFSPPSSAKRSRTCLQGISPPYQFPTTTAAASTAAMHAGFTNLHPQISVAPNPTAAVTTLADSMALPLLYCAAGAAPPPKGKEIDLNMRADHPPEELDLLLQLQEPSPKQPAVISPRPVRPVGSSIIVNRIAEDPRGQTVAKAPEEVEEAVEAEAAPAIVSDSNNKVRVCNSAYKEMVGQPECCWLDCATSGKRCRGGERIGGEVSLQFVETKLEPSSSAAFSCTVRIEWEREGKKMSVDARCSAVKLVCETKDYQFLWRFHTTAPQDAQDHVKICN